MSEATGCVLFIEATGHHLLGFELNVRTMGGKPNNVMAASQ